MIVVPEQCYPLRWPEGAPRSRSQLRTPFKSVNDVGPEIAELYRELRLVPQVVTIIVSSNMPTRSDGLPASRSSQRPDGDSGVVAYWTRKIWRAGRDSLVPYAMPCDRFDRIADNLHALAKSINAMRGMERWGAVSFEQAFAAFAALPAGDGSTYGATPVVVDWRSVFGGTWPDDLEADELLVLAKSRYRKLSRDAHPDGATPDADRMVRLNAAMTACETELAP